MNPYERKIKLLRERFGSRIAEATAKTYVPARLVAALIALECGFDSKRGVFNEGAGRFESHVYARLLSLRDTGQYINGRGRTRTSYEKVTQADLAGATAEAVRNLATSWGPGQIMGYNVLHWDCTIADLRDPAQSIRWVVRKLLEDAGSAIRRKEFDDVLRIWNTGSPDGQTHDPDYVAHGKRYMVEWDRLGPVPFVESEVAAWKTAGAEDPSLDIDTPETPSGDPVPPSESGTVAAPVPDGSVADASTTTTATTTTVIDAPVSTVTSTASTTVQPVEGGAITDDARAVTKGSGSWVRSILGGIAAIWAVGSGHIEKFTGLSPDAQKVAMVVIGLLLVTWLVCKAVAERQVRAIASDPTKQNVK